MKNIFLITSLLVFLDCCAQKKDATIPFELIDNRPFITVYVNGKPLHFILDTGAGNCIDKDVAIGQGIALTNAGSDFGAGDSAVQTWSATADSMRINDIHLQNRSLNVISLKNIKEKLHLPYLDGIIGYPFMKDYIVQFDFPGRLIRLMQSYKGNNPVKMKRYGTIPLVDIMIDGIPATVIIDTGDRSYFSMMKNFSDQHHLRVSGDTTVTGYGVGGPIMAQMYLVKKLVCGISFTNVTTRVPIATGGLFASTDLDGSIGTGMLKDHVMTIDYLHNIIYFD